ncbi:MAG TPA: MFS transporter, partial [Hyphomicrobiales bacterium]|nr:MFS transporter [Hyphomicrobiales bacterium]
MISYDAPSEKPRAPSLAILVAVTALGPVSLNLFVPSMPGLQAAFDIDYSTAQLTLSLYLAALATAQLIVGPLSDRFGRRPALLGGTALFVVASIGCAFALSIEQLILGRIVQAIGGCAGIVIARAAIRDRYDRDEAASKFGYITVAMIAVPMAAPALGGYLDEIGGWRLGFHAVSALGIAVLALAWSGFGETHHPGHDSGGGFLRLARTSGALIREPVFLGYSLAVAFSTA